MKPKTTLSSNVTGTNATGIHKINLAENITSANAFTKEIQLLPSPPGEYLPSQGTFRHRIKYQIIQNTDKNE
jgi:hypothetical protein